MGIALIPPHLTARTIRVDIGNHGAPRIVLFISHTAPDGSSCGSIAQHGLGSAELLTRPYLQTVARGVELAQVQRIAVSVLTAVEPLSVVVDGHAAIDHLVHAVIVDIAYRQRMEALGGILTVGLAVLALAALGGVEIPASRQFAVGIVPGFQHAALIDPTADKHRGCRATEVGHGHAQA